MKILVLYGSTPSKNSEELLETAMNSGHDVLSGNISDVSSEVSQRGSRFWLKDFDVTEIPLDDKKTFELLKKAKTLGIFQLESSGVRDLLRKLKPTVFEDIIALTSLYRPGPMGSGMLDEFVMRKHQRNKIKYYPLG